VTNVDPNRPDVGLCARCSQAIVQRSARGNEFWRCGAADEDARLLRYPPLPVRGCPAFSELEAPPEP
jgi:hypothetical protein